MRLTWFVPGLAVLLSAAACTSADPAGSTIETTSTTSLSTAQFEQVPTTPLDPSVLARQRLIDLIDESGWGVDADNVLNGPAGLTIDLDACPGRWADDLGANDERIDLTLFASVSGNLNSIVEPHVQGFNSYVDMINEAGGVDGRLINIDSIDVSYIAGWHPIETFADDQRLGQPSSNPLAVLTYGTPDTLRATGLLGEACIPLVTPFGLGHSETHDPVGYPWTWAGPLEYQNEIDIWLSEINQRFTATPAKVTAVVMNNEFGLNVRDSLMASAHGHPAIDSIEVVLHEPADQAPVVNITDETDVVLLLTAGQPCESLIDQLDSFDGMKLMVSVCRPGQFAQEPDAETDDNEWRRAHLSTSSLGHILDPARSDVVEQELSARDLDPTDPYIRRGFVLDGWLIVELLEIASALPGGLSRTNLILATWAMATENDWYRNVELTN